MCWFPEFSLHAKPLSRLLWRILWQKHSAFTPKIHFVYFMYSYCCFYHCDMVQSFPSFLSRVSRMYILPLGLTWSTTDSIISNVAEIFLGPCDTHGLVRSHPQERWEFADYQTAGVFCLFVFSYCIILCVYCNGDGRLHICCVTLESHLTNSFKLLIHQIGIIKPICYSWWLWEGSGET